MERVYQYGEGSESNKSLRQNDEDISDPCVNNSLDGQIQNFYGNNGSKVDDDNLDISHES